jgi:hypothetical protein
VPPDASSTAPPNAGRAVKRPLPPGPSSRPKYLLPVVVVIVVVVATSGIVLVLVGGSSTPASHATITSDGFTWTPGQFCENNAIPRPQTPFTVTSGARFNLSWYLICETSTNSSVPNHGTIVGVRVETSGFGLVSSNAPVQVGNVDYTYFNVTLTAPSGAYEGPVSVALVTPT